ncbi:unnamed protein product, partial [Amoebophrya sp. A120]
YRSPLDKTTQGSRQKGRPSEAPTALVSGGLGRPKRDAQNAALRKRQRIRIIWASFWPTFGPRKIRHQNPPLQRRTEGQKMQHFAKQKQKKKARQKQKANPH